MPRLYHDAIIKGEIDNRQPDRITGRLWLVGQEQPVKLHLTGNCAADIAGCLVEFFNPAPAPQDLAPLHRIQTGSAGRMTASERAQEPDGTFSNRLAIAWQSDQDGEIEITSTRYKLRVFDHEWEMQDLAPFTPVAPRGPTEWQWEIFLRHPRNLGDEQLQAFGRFLDEGRAPDHERPAYLQLPDLDTIWAHDEDALGDSDPDPEREGIDWVRDDLGDVHHPFTLQCRTFAMRLWQYCHSLDLFETPDDPDIRTLLEQVERFSSRVARALDDLAYDERPDYPYVVAQLKRALASLHLAMNAVHRVQRKRALAGRAGTFGDCMFALREELIHLMTDFRTRH